MHDLDDPYPYLAELRKHHPVARVEDSDFHIVATWDLIDQVLERQDDFSANLTSTMLWTADGRVEQNPIAELGSPLHVLATADDPLHRLHRRAVLPSVSARRLRRLQPMIESALDTLWQAGLDDDRMDWMAAVAQRLPMTVVIEVIGLRDCDVDDLLRWSFASTALLDGPVTQTQLDQAAVAVGELAAYLSDQFTTACAAPEENAIGDIARAVASGDVEQDAAITMLIQLVIAGAESTVSLLGSLVWMLGEQPDLQRQIREQRDLVSDFVEEVLRLESPFRGHFRHVVRDTELGGTRLPADAHLYLSWASANRDETVFDAPDALRLGGQARGSHLAFGRGPHRCLGAGLARIEAKTALDFLLDHTEWVEVSPDKPDWERSMLVRRLTTLPIHVTPAR